MSVLSAEISQFLSEHIHSIAQLELLLLLHRNPEKHWTIADAAKELYISHSMTEPLLTSLGSVGLISSVEDSGRRYQFAPKTQQLEKLVNELAQLYAERRVSIINAIYSGPLQKLQDFSDAFRFRDKEKE